LDGIIVFDRCVDLLTPVLTQFSYSGQLDEQHKIVFNEIFVETSILELGLEDDEMDDKFKEKKFQGIRLKKEDKFYSQIRDVQIDAARGILTDKLKAFKAMTAQLGQTKKDDNSLLKKVVLEKKNLRKYKIHLLLAMNLQKNLQTPNNLALIEHEQVRIKLC